jgi:hypothetical protein
MVDSQEEITLAEEQSGEELQQQLHLMFVK